MEMEEAKPRVERIIEFDFEHNRRFIGTNDGPSFAGYSERLGRELSDRADNFVSQFFDPIGLNFTPSNILGAVAAATQLPRANPIVPPLLGLESRLYEGCRNETQSNLRTLTELNLIDLISSHPAHHRVHEEFISPLSFYDSSFPPKSRG